MASSPSLHGVTRYRAYCDQCGRNVSLEAADLGTTRVRAGRHARLDHHAVRIEPEFGFVLVEMVWPDRATRCGPR